MEANLRRESLTYDDRTISLVTHEPFMKNKILFMFALVALFGGSTLADTHSLAKPNVVYIMADDIDWGDLSTHGGGEPTPNIDRLFARGVELRHFMGWCVCSPTRAMLLTGRHPIAWEPGLRLVANSIPLRRRSRKVSNPTATVLACFGKWHLDMKLDEKSSNKKEKAAPIGAAASEGPIARGFDIFAG